MPRVLGLGGLFFRSTDPAALREWYGRVLGLEFDDWGGLAFTPDAAMEQPGAATVFCPFDASTDYFGAAENQFMFNLMVDDLAGVLARCAEHAVTPVGDLLDEANGRFAHIIDPEGRKIELWEPKNMQA